MTNLPEESTLSHTHRATLPVPPAEVFAALTAPASLTHWFAESVEIEPRVDGAFRFWGRHSYGAPSRADATQRITAWEPGRQLGFSWNFDGAPSRVLIDLAEAEATEHVPAGTALVLTHEFDAPQERNLVDDFWKLTMGNLAAHLAGGDGIVLPDYTDPDPAIRMSIVINAPREKVFRALVEPEAMKRWLGAPAPVVDLREGGEYRYGWAYEVNGRQVVGGPTRILELIPGERLVTDWPDWRGDPDLPPTRVAWQLDSLPDGSTRVSIVHGGFPRAVDMSDYPFGWGWFMGQFKQDVETKL